MYRHYFRCASCGKHVISITEDSVPTPPARTHTKALEEGGRPAASGDSTFSDCIGELRFCSGVVHPKQKDWMNPDSYKPCVPAHQGSALFEPAPEPKEDPVWQAFADRVNAAWDLFVANNYAPAFRGANNNREYRPPQAVSRHLQGSQGAVVIRGATYTISNSLTAGVSLHRTIPVTHQVGNMRSFIYHL